MQEGRKEIGKRKSRIIRKEKRKRARVERGKERADNRLEKVK